MQNTIENIALPLLMIVMVVAVYYFSIKKPQQKQKKEQKEIFNKLKPGVEIITYGGLIGIVKSVDTEKERIFIQSSSAKLVISNEAVYKIIKED